VIADGGWGWEPADMGHGVENKSTAAQLRNTINKNNAKAAAALSKKGKKK